MISAAASEARPGSGVKILCMAGAVSLLAHLGLYHSLPSRPSGVAAGTVAVQVQWIEAAPPARAQPAKERQKPGPQPVVRTRVKSGRRGPAQTKSAPAPASPAPEPAAAAPPRIPPASVGIAPAATVQESAFVVPKGNTLSGEPARAAQAGAPSGAGRGGAYVRYDQLSEPPVLITEVRAGYPEAARKAGFAGDVIVRVTIDAQGRVAEVRRISGPGHGLDEVALAALQQFRFRPAQYKGAPVATVIRYIYSFNIK